jgi:hypothetical protein
MTNLHSAIRNLLDSLPANMMVIFIYDHVDKIVGFAIVDREDKTNARIFDLNGEELSDVLTKVNISEADNTLRHKNASYVS